MLIKRKTRYYVIEKLAHVMSRDVWCALRKLAKAAYDCVFMDIQMPEMDGVETTEAIRSGRGGVNSGVVIVALTAHSMKGDREKFLAAGMDDYLAKPIEMERLQAVLDRCFSVARHR